ncbi:zinc-dependent alcohol dehydrogenase [Trueperella abortisuis]|uniref:2-desacetyl-2-hydroxyethyl bacteriochlorophyllide A dehydrogenase n=1 Tax=Trueperella abortisuis TaxID=445930 RepID=A0ABT9PGI7_9ACTO|nr:alcohol dehydrogenase catalytic domain-containing protein [Trueperella abortisuis]MDP9831601.1 2-desacetyl-2-hydroxyethyl bacteriochlorophyllide A dehydrogenase [Trueperella abortisuis]
MKAIRFDTKQCASVVDIPKPEPASGNVVIRVTSAGVCGSDISALTGTHLFRVPPLISGHEGGGVIEAVGADIEHISVADRVVIDPQRPCGSCDYCARGDYHLCATKTMLGVAQWDGCFAEFVEVPAYCCIPAPANVGDEYLALAEPIAVAAHAVRQLGARRFNRTLVLGGGTIGSLITRVLSDKGADVTVSEPREFLAEKLISLGANRVVIPEDLAEFKYDAIFIAAGVPALIEVAMAHLAPGGAIVQVAVFKNPVELHVGELQVREQALLGTAMYTKEDFKTALDLLSRYPNIPEILVSKIVDLETAAKKITEMGKHGPGNTLKLLMKP